MLGGVVDLVYVIFRVEMLGLLVVCWLLVFSGLVFASFVC